MASLVVLGGFVGQSLPGQVIARLGCLSVPPVDLILYLPPVPHLLSGSPIHHSHLSTSSYHQPLLFLIAVEN